MNRPFAPYANTIAHLLAVGTMLLITLIALGLGRPVHGAATDRMCPGDMACSESSVN